MDNLVLKLKCWFYTKMLYHHLKMNNKEGVERILAKKINLLKSSGNTLG